jgi:hypothetical protein
MDFNFPGAKFRGWDITISSRDDVPLIDPRIPGFLCAIDLGASVMHEPALQSSELRADVNHSTSPSSSSVSSAKSAGNAPASNGQSVITSAQLQALIARVDALESSNSKLKQELESLKTSRR